MGKKKNNSQPRAQHSFQDLVAQATLSKFGPYIDQQIQQAAQAILQRQAQANANLLTRLTATEEVLFELVPGLTKDRLATQVAVIQDRGDGMEESTAEVQKGDRVRIEIKTKTAEQKDYAGSSRILVDDVGTGATLGNELESVIVGMVKGETREALFGKDNSMSASITLNRVSRLTKEEAEARAKAKEARLAQIAAAQAAAKKNETEETQEAPQEAAPAQTEETTNAASAG